MKYFVAVVFGAFLFTTAMAAERADERDEAVLKAALNELLPREAEEKPPVLIVDEITAQFPTFRRPKIRMLPGGGFAVPRGGGKPTEEEMDGLFDAITKRNSGGGTNKALGARVSIAALALGPQVVVSPEPEKVMKEFREKHGFPKSWLAVSLPGYSADGKRAVVSLQRKGHSHSERQVFHAFFERHNEEWKFLSMIMYSLPGQTAGK